MHAPHFPDPPTLAFLGENKARETHQKTRFLGVHSLSLEHETSTDVLANLRRELANVSRELANFKRELAEAKRKLAAFKPIRPALTNFTQEIAGINLQI